MKHSLLFLYYCAFSGWLGSTVRGLLLGESRKVPRRHQEFKLSSTSRTWEAARRGRPFSASVRVVPTALHAGNDSGIGSTEIRKEDDLPANFNPFNYQRSSSTSNFNQRQSYLDLSSNRISLRKARMQEITNQLLVAAATGTSTVVPSPGADGDGSTMRTIMNENRDFLLEPLESDDAVLDPDSVLYQNGNSVLSPMSRSERYRLYRNELQERIGRAKNAASRKVLQALHDFVLSHE